MTTRREALKSAALLPFAALPVRAAPVVSGAPLAGHFTHDSVRLWVQSTEEAKATLRYWPATGKEDDAKSLALALGKDNGFCTIAEVTGLQPATVYRYRVSFDGAAAGAMGNFRTTAAPGSPARDFRVYIGSCAYTEAYTRGGNPYGANLHIFDTMAGRMGADDLPHFMLWLGDNLYLRGPSPNLGVPAEYSTPAHMEIRYKDVRSQLQLRKLFAATHHYAIWDDHDFGPNDSDRTFELKDASLKLFHAYWPNPPMGSKDLPGTWCRFTHQDAEFFLLDNRFYRDPEKAPRDPGKQMLGPAQMEWLKKGLADSRATFKLVVGGSQFLSEAKPGDESGWHEYPGEREPFLAWLKANPVKGLVLLSGDRHNTQLLREGPVQEFSCSPLTSKIIKLSKPNWDNPRLDKESVVETQNYGTLEFTGTGASRKLVGRSFDADGRLLWMRELA